jgi:hypothetical protein
MLACALFYAARGWAVFPVHGIREGVCTCPDGAACKRPGKHPRNGNGRTGATTDAAQVRRWWSTWPEANIGIATGRESGIIVKDRDDLEAVLPGEIPRTITARTGGGGLHHVYAYPPDGVAHISSTNVLAQGVDSRADGGYIVAPPSMHASGARYEWLPGQAPGECQCASPPEWWLRAIRRDKPCGPSAVPAWQPEGELPENIRDMLRTIPADDYTVWRNVGLALNHTDPEGGLQWWDWWSQTAGNYDAKAVQSQWRSMTRRGHRCARPLTIAHIEQLAREHGYVDPMIEAGAAIHAGWVQAETEEASAALVARVEARPGGVAPDILPAGGLIREIVDYILATSIRPQPELAVAAATCYLGALYGRKWHTETDLRTGIYAVGLAESGAGKEHARTIIGQLAYLSGTSNYLGGERIASGPGLIAALARNGSQLFMIDEFGMLLASMVGGRADPHKRDLMSTLMTVYGSADKIYRGIEYGDQEKRKRVDLVQPCVSIYGTSTPSTFFGALTSLQSIDGSMARMLVVPAVNDRPERQRPAPRDPPAVLLEALKLAAAPQAEAGNLESAVGSQVMPSPVTVPMTTATLGAWEALDDDAGHRAKSCGPVGILWTRTAENAARLALVHALSLGRAEIDGDSLAWGATLARWTAQTMIRECEVRVADNEVEAQHKRVAIIVRDAGPQGIGQNELTRRCQWLRRRELDEALGLLQQAGILIREQQATAGRPRTVYVWVGKSQD